MPFIGLLDYMLHIVGQNSNMCSGVVVWELCFAPLQI